jgi:hypothetical protein
MIATLIHVAIGDQKRLMNAGLWSKMLKKKTRKRKKQTACALLTDPKTKTTVRLANLPTQLLATLIHVATGDHPRKLNAGRWLISEKRNNFA